MRSIVMAFTTAISVLGIFTAPVFADSSGEKEYMSACASCHGESAKGDGPIARLINIPTPSLTTLSLQNEGRFPFEEVLKTIDGRGGIRAHGSSMPIWGERFLLSATNQRGDEEAWIVKGRILSLVYYLESIQE